MGSGDAGRTVNPWGLLRQQSPEPGQLRQNWAALSAADRIKTAREWRAAAAAGGNLPAARIYWEWEQEARSSLVMVLPDDAAKEEDQKGMLRKEEVITQKETQDEKKPPSLSASVHLEVRVDPKSPCLKARLLQISRRLARWGDLKNLFLDDQQARGEWKGHLNLPFILVKQRLDQAENVAAWGLNED